MAGATPTHETMRIWVMDPGLDGADETWFDSPADAGEAAVDMAEYLWDDNGPGEPERSVKLTVREVPRWEWEAMKEPD